MKLQLWVWGIVPTSLIASLILFVIAETKQSVQAPITPYSSRTTVVEVGLHSPVKNSLRAFAFFFGIVIPTLSVGIGLKEDNKRQTRPRQYFADNDNNSPNNNKRSPVQQSQFPSPTSNNFESSEQNVDETWEAPE
ncbi:MAG: hypothetical protein ACPGED_12840, partial [Flavobacteriales bacterium]